MGITRGTYRKEIFIGTGLVFVCMLICPYILYAQTDSTKKLKQVDVSSSKAPKTSTVTPMQQITASDFTKYSAFNVADAIKNFAGVNIKDYGGIGGLKTVSVRSLGADNTAVLYNGVQLNDAQNGQIDLSKFNLNNIQQIALYNAQPPEICQTARAYASANVLSVTTVQPQLTPEKPFKIIAGIKGGSFGLVNPYLQWQQRINTRWTFVLNAMDEEANGRYKYKVTGDESDTLAIRRNSNIHALQADGGLYWRRSDNNKFSLQFNYYNSSRGLPAAVVYYASLDGQHLYSNDLFMQSSYMHIAKNSLQLLFNTKVYQSTTRYTDTGVFNNTGMIDEHYKQRELYLSAAIAYNLLSNWKVSYSSDADISNMQSDVYKYDFPTRLSLYNVAATDLQAGKWHLQGNVLNTYIHDEVKTGKAASAKSALSPALIATYQPLKDNSLLIRAYYKNTFRNPTFAEQYYYAIVPRPLKPESAEQYDMGLVYTKNTSGVVDYITISTDAYYNHIKNKIIYIPTRNPNTPSATNLGEVEVTGLDVVIKSQFNPFYKWKGTLSANYSYQQALDVTNPTDIYYLEQIPYTPKSTLAINAGLTHKQLGIYYNQIISTHRYQISNNTADSYLPGYAISDASLVYNFLIGGMPLMASAEINNLFNKSYSIISSYPMPGRSFRFTLQISI